MPLHSYSEHTLQPNNLLVFLFISALFATSCATVKKAPVNVPFVYNNVINLKAPKLGGEAKSLLTEKLYTYLDDSLQVPQRKILGFTQRLRPPVFDSGNVTRSITFMNGYLNSIGYYAARFDTFTVKMDTIAEKKQIRVSTTFNVNVGKNLTVDTLIYALDTPNVQPFLKHLADSAVRGALLRKNSPYSKDAVAAELERLATLFRNNGFFRMSRSALIIEADTTDPSLISFDNDPIEQLLEAQKRKEDPRIVLKVMQRPGVDSSVFRQYYIDSVYIYPETKITEDQAGLINDTSFTTVIGKRPIIIKDREGLFRPNLIRRNNYLLPGKLYDDAAYFRTVNNFWRMGPWQQVDVKTFLHYDSIAKVNFHVFLYPAKKQNFQLDLEGSQNNNISVSNSLSGRFFAISLNATHRGRNLFRSGVQSVSSARVGFEINSPDKNTPFFQTFIANGSQSFSIPKLTWPFAFIDRRKLDATRTQVSFSALYSDRFNFYKQISFTAAMQWELRKGKNSFSWSLPNFESFSIRDTDSLRKEIAKNPALRYAFTPGNILSAKLSWEHKMSFPRNPRRAGYFRFAGEVSPLKFKLFNRESFQFYRVEGQIVHSLQHAKSSMNYRVYAGVGWNFNKDPLTGKQASLPYYRQYVAGGSNSMRAWSLRQLGVGRSIVSDTTQGFSDRFGDIQIEGNAEFRYKLFRLFGFNIGGAVFTDIGNIWNHTNNADNEGKFFFKNLYRDLAMDIGTGIRWDVSYLVIRLDAAYKLKDPVREGAGWIQNLEWKGKNRLGSPAKNNVGFQFGIGYPF